MTDKFELLVKNGDAGLYQDGDIVEMAPAGHEWGLLEGAPRFRIETVDSSAFYSRDNVIAPLLTGIEDLPIAVKRSVRLLVRYARVQKRKVIRPCRYRLVNGTIEDKKHDQNG